MAVKSFRYLLTDPRQFDILQSGWLAGIECNSINSDDVISSRFSAVQRRRGRSRRARSSSRRCPW